MSRTARGNALEAALRLVMTRAGLLVTGFRCWKSAIEWLTTTSGDESAARLSAAEIARAMEQSVDAAARHLPLATNCLDRALTLWWMLRRRGLPAELCIGARKNRERFEAHAWVEMGSAVLDAAEVSGSFNAFERSIATVGTEAQ